jgi:hypothetical protein
VTLGAVDGLSLFLDRGCRGAVQVGAGAALQLGGALYAPSGAVETAGHGKLTAAAIVAETVQAGGTSVIAVR